MILLSTFDLNLPLTNPVLIFALILFIILFTPIILNKFSIPHLIGLIIAGIVIGPFGFNLMARDSSIVLFGTVGLLYIMFLAGLEIDMADFKKNSTKSLVFGLFTFVIPMTMGTLGSYYLLNFPLNTSVLLASMFASHTLIAYPIVSKLGIIRNPAVSVAVGGTLITDTLALLVLAVIAGMASGNITDDFFIRLTVSVLIFAMIVVFLFPVIGRWFFKNNNDNISQYIFVLAMVFFGAFLAEAAGIEAIIGAFLAGLALNRLIPHTSPLMNRIEFVGNALFIPFFLIGVGMLIDFRTFFTDRETIIVAIFMTVTATAAKFLAAWATQKTFGFNTDQRRIIFGLSNAQAAATLAAVLVGYNIITGQDVSGEPVRLLNESILNGTILMILVTCTIASFVTQKGGQNLVQQEANSEEFDEEGDGERILIPLSNIDNVEELINLSVTVQSSKRFSKLLGLNILDTLSADPNAEKHARKLMELAEKTASASDNQLHPVVRYDSNIANGISSVVQEHKITDLIIGLHKKKGLTDTFLGDLTQGILLKCNTTTLIYRPVQPFSTISRYLVFVPDHADKESGFPFWLLKIWNIGKHTGSKLVFYGSEEILGILKEIHKNHPVDAAFREFSNWDDFLILGREFRDNDNLLFVMSRKDYPSWQAWMTKISHYLNSYFTENNFILIYPKQLGVMEADQFNPANPSMYDPLNENLERLDALLTTIGKLFRKK